MAAHQSSWLHGRMSKRPMHKRNTPGLGDKVGHLPDAPVKPSEFRLTFTPLFDVQRHGLTIEAGTHAVSHHRGYFVRVSGPMLTFILDPEYRIAALRSGCFPHTKTMVTSG